MYAEAIARQKLLDVEYDRIWKQIGKEIGSEAIRGTENGQLKQKNYRHNLESVQLNRRTSLDMVNDMIIQLRCSTGSILHNQRKINQRRLRFYPEA